MKTNTIILKFGGAAFKKPDDFIKRASFIKKLTNQYGRIVVVVSAMENMTSDLLNLAKKIHEDPPKREQDMLVSIGERMSMALLAMALNKLGLDAVSYTGSQSGIITTSSHFEAKIIDVRPVRILEALSQNKVVIVAGFQGVSEKKEVTTLGLGGSDTTAVALGVALKAEIVRFCKDVEGVYKVDPKKEKFQKPFSYLNYNEALAIVQNGAKILHPRSVLLAKRNKIPLLVASFLPASFEGTWIEDKGLVRDSMCVYEN